MASRAKEDEKNERIIRNLLKLPENRRCINCNSLGPQYVCTNFWTFVCTNCSGIHREFTHRVKSISMAKFTSQEVAALQGGGNAHAKEIYFKELDQQRHSFPDRSNVERLRDFIKHVYVDRRYTGERSFDKPPRVKMGEVDDTYENKRNDTFQSGSRSPASEDTYDRRYSDRPSPGGRSDDRNYRNSFDERSPGYEQESRPHGDYRRSPAGAEILNDWRREDRFGNRRRTEDGRISDGSSKLEGRSPDRQKDLDMSSPPMVRPVRDILGENVSPLRIEPPKANGSMRTQRTASSSSLASSNGNPTDTKNENVGSLIDFDVVPEPPVSAATPQTQQAVTDKGTELPNTSPNADNWACFDSNPNGKVSSAPSNSNAFESVLSQLSAPTSISGHSAVTPDSISVMPGANMLALPSSSNSLVAPPGQMSVSTFGNHVPAIVPANNLAMFPPVSTPLAASVGHVSVFGVPGTSTASTFAPFPAGAAPTAVSGSPSVLPSTAVNSYVKAAGGGQWSGMPPKHHSSFPATGNQPATQPLAPPLGGSSSYQPWDSAIAPNALASSNVPPAQTSRSVSRPALEAISAVVAQSSSTEPKSALRKELPQDLFTATYTSHVAIPGWQTAPPQGFGHYMSFNTVMPMPMLPQSSKSTNPFDLNNERPAAQVSTFPSMASLQGALPNVVAPPSSLLHTSSLGAPAPMWTPQSSYSSSLPQAPPLVSAMPPSAYMGQSVPNNLPLRQQGVVGFGSGGLAFGSSNPGQQHQQLGGIYSAPATTNSFPTVGGNPFG